MSMIKSACTLKRNSIVFGIFIAFFVFLFFTMGGFIDAKGIYDTPDSHDSHDSHPIHDSFDKQKIRVGWFIVDGYQFYDSHGNRSGYGYDYLHELSHYGNYEYEFVDGTWEECYQWLKEGKIDLLTFAQRTDERAKEIAFTETSMGEAYSTITALNSNKNISYDNPNSLHGKTVAGISGSIQISQFEEWCKDKGIKCKVVGFIDPPAALPSLYNGTVDALLTTSFRKMTMGEKMIAKFSPNQIRMAVSKNNLELKASLEESMSRIQFDHPTLISALNDKYFSSNIEKSHPLSQSEKEYLKSLPRLRVVSNSERPPLVYNTASGEAGFYIDVFDLLCRKLNISYDYISTDNYEQALEMIKNGEADIVLDFAFDYTWADENNVTPTATYITMQYCKIEPKSSNGKERNLVAAAKGRHLTDAYIKKHYPEHKIKWYDNTTQCIEAIRKGECDVTFTTTYTSDYFLAEYKYNNLMSTHIGFTQNPTIAIANKHNPLLATLFSRAISGISPTELNEIMAKHTLRQPEEIGVWKIVYENPLLGLLIVGIISSVIVALLIITIHFKSRYNKRLIENINTDRITQGMSFEKFIIESGRLTAARGLQKYGILYLDIQNFKYINETFGRTAGDNWLKGVHQCLISSLHEDELAARAYADHFIVCYKFVDKKTTRERLEALWKNINELSNEFAHYCALFRVGIYVLQDNDTEITKAIDSAIYALNTLDTISENSVAYYNEDMRTRFEKERTLERDMSSALENHDFLTYYQPKCNIHTKEITGAEALVRWSHPVKGLIPPNDFIPFFEKNNFIVKLDLYMFEQVSRHMREMMDKGITPVPTSINFSRHHLRMPNWTNTLLEIANKYNVPTNLYELELTETVAEENFNLVANVARRLREAGFKIAIDDFGSGYSSIQLLYKIPIDVLKMDKSCFDIEEHSKIKREVLESVVEAAIQNDIHVIWEGVETPEQVQLINEFRCSSAQGFFYYRPMPYDEFQTLLKSQQDNKDSSNKE